MSKSVAEIQAELYADLVAVYRKHAKAISLILPDQPPAGADVCQNYAISALFTLWDWFRLSDTVPDERKAGAFFACAHNAVVEWRKRFVTDMGVN